MPQKLAARLLKPHHDRIAQAVARQIRRTVPRYEQVEPIALERNLKTVLRGVQRLLEQGDGATLLRVLEDVAQLRSSTGFQVSELLLAAMCFNPVVRRFLVGSAPTVGEGLAAWEAVESVTLPLFGQLVDLFLDSEDEVTPPFGHRLPPTTSDGFLLPLTIESVLEDEEITPV